MNMKLTAKWVLKEYKEILGDNMKERIKKLRHNHGLMMIICCGIPLVLLLFATYFFGLKNKYFFWFILLLCPLMHYFMMKDMHKKHSKDKTREKCH